MITRSVQLSLLVLVSASVCSAVPVKRSATPTYNLKSLERRMEAHAKRAAKRGDAAEVSETFKAVQDGMKKGNYHYDLETARAVAREVHAHRMPASPRWLEEAPQSFLRRQGYGGQVGVGN